MATENKKELSTYYFHNPYILFYPLVVNVQNRTMIYVNSLPPCGSGLSPPSSFILVTPKSPTPLYFCVYVRSRQNDRLPCKFHQNMYLKKVVLITLINIDW